MNDRLRTTLASAALVASLSIAGVANASGGDDDQFKPREKDKVCKKKQSKGKGYLVQGFFVEGALDQVAGADTERWGDDRWSGTVVLEVTKGNRRGERDLGLSSYEVKNVRVIGAAEGVLPEEGTRLELVGTQRKACASAPSEPEPENEHPGPKPPKPHHPKPPKPTDPVPTTPAPTTPAPTTPPPTTPAPTTPDPTATTLEYDHDDHGGDDEYDEYEDGSDEGEQADDDEAEVATPVTDVKVRVVHFKVRKSGKR